MLLWQKTKNDDTGAKFINAFEVIRSLGKGVRLLLACARTHTPKGQNVCPSQVCAGSATAEHTCNVDAFRALAHIDELTHKRARKKRRSGK